MLRDGPNSAQYSYFAYDNTSGMEKRLLPNITIEWTGASREANYFCKEQ